MGTAWGPGRYDGTGSQQNNGLAGQTGGACDCSKTCCIASTEVHYQVVANSGQTAIDSPGGQGKTLTNRIAIEFYNAGTAQFEVGNIPFAYNDGSGRPVAPGASFSLMVGPAQPTKGLTHYVQFSGTGTNDCRITELGI